MRKNFIAASFGAGLAGIAPAAFALTQDEALANVTMLMLYGSIAFALLVIACVYFMKSRDKRDACLREILGRDETIHSVVADTLVSDCVRLMTSRKIGALVILEGAALRGIFTERDALNRVLAAGLDPARVKVSEVMTANPTVVSPGTTVQEAMGLITTRRFRHLPIVENGKLLAIVSSGDLTRWLVRDQVGEVQELVLLAAQT